MPGRPIAFEREALLETALQEFWRHGYSGVSVNGLSDKFGIKRSSFYNSFGSLDELFAEVLLRYMSRAPLARMSKKSNLQENYSPIKLIRTSFRLLCKERAGELEKKGCLLVNSLGGFDTLSEDAKKVTLNALKNGKNRVGKFLLDAVELGELPADSDIETLQNAIQTLTLGINNVSKIVTTEKKLWNIAEATLNGLGLTENP